MSRVDVLVQYLFCWKKFAVYVIIVNNFDTDFQCTWLRKRFFTKFTQMIFLNFMYWINVKSQISWGSEGFPTRITNFVFFFGYHGLSWCVSSDNSNQWMYFHRNNIYDRFFFPWITLIWFFKLPDRPKYFPQWSHLYFFFAFMNYFDMILQMLWSSEVFGTRITFMIPLTSLMNYLLVIFQIFWSSK